MRITHRDSRWLSLFLFVITFTAGCASNSNFTQEQSPSQTQDVNSPDKASAKETIETVKQNLIKFPGKVWRNGKATYTKPENLAALLIAGGASIAMHQDADEKIADYFDKHQVLHGSDAETFNIIGHPTVHTAAASIWYLLSISNKDDINIERAWTMRTALAITWLTTAALKTARDNETPNGENRAWPSGHTGSSFTVASVLDEYYGPKVGIPAYAVASLVAYRMMDTGDHWGSDVVFGATLGWVVGHTVAGQNKDHKIAGFDIVPFIPETEKPAFGIGFVKRY